MKPFKHADVYHAARGIRAPRPVADRARLANPQGPGRKRGAVARRGQHHPVHHPLPQGTHRRAGRGSPPHRSRSASACCASSPTASRPSSRASRARASSPTSCAPPSSRPTTPSGSKTSTCRTSRRSARLATAAREKGLEPLALAVWNSDPAVANLDEVLPTLVNPEKELNTAGGRADRRAAHPRGDDRRDGRRPRRRPQRAVGHRQALTTAKSEKLAEGQGLEYKDYFQFTEPIRHIPPHRILAINRGEKENALQVKLEWDAETGHARRPGTPAVAAARRVADASRRPRRRRPKRRRRARKPPAPAPRRRRPTERAARRGNAAGGDAAGRRSAHRRTEPAAAAPPRNPAAAVGRADRSACAIHPHADFLEQAADDALDRLLVPSLEREIRRELTQRGRRPRRRASSPATCAASCWQPPLRGRRVLAIDPGFRTGCKLAALDETGNLLEDGVDLSRTRRRTSATRPRPGWKSWSASISSRSSPSATAPPAARPRKSSRN